MTPEQLLARAPALARHHLLGLPKPRRRLNAPLRPLPEPRADMLRYTAVLRQLVAEAKALVRRELVPHLPDLVSEASRFTGERTDDVSDSLAAILEAVRQALGLSEQKARRWAMEMLERVQRSHAQRFVDAYEGRLAVNPLAGAEPWVRDQMALAVKENTRLITSLPEQMLDQIEGVVHRGVLAGKRHEDLAKLIAERFDVADSRATLIARDQVLKWHGSLTRLRHADAGVTEYEWSTSRDERVRPTHRVRDGKTYKWTASPKPGEEVLCRCAAIPVAKAAPETVPMPSPIILAPAPVPVPRPAPLSVPQSVMVPAQASAALAQAPVAIPIAQQQSTLPKLAPNAPIGTIAKPTPIKYEPGSFDLDFVSPEGEVSGEGYIRVSTTEAPGLLTVKAVEVNEARRRGGFGTQLYRAAQELADSRGLLLASDTERSASAEAFWQKQVKKGIARYEPSINRYVLTGRI